MGATRSARSGSADEREYELRCRFLLRAYPRRWREARGDEVLGVLLDLRADGARSPTAREAAGLVRGGWATRWRLRPPLLAWLLHRLFDRRLPVEALAWQEDDVRGWLWPARASLAGLILPVVLWSVSGTMPPPAIAAWCVVWVVLAVATARGRRRRALSGIADQRARWPLARGASMASPHRPLAAGPWLRGAAAATAAAGLALVLVGGAGPAGLLVPALAVGASPLLALRCAGPLAVRPAQPHRADPLPPATGQAVSVGLLAVAVAAACGWMSRTLWTARIPSPLAEGLAPAAVVPGLLGAPTALGLLGCALMAVAAAAASVERVARAAERTPGPPVALRDVVRAALRGRPPLTQPPRRVEAAWLLRPDA